jgi:tRNA(fMet)-specific endonuclease VapC
MKYLLDTNILSEPNRLNPDAQVIERLEQYGGLLATATVVIHELMFGYLRLPTGKRRDVLQDYLESAVLPCLPVLPYDLEAAQRHAQERARLQAQGIVSQFTDGQIAAIAHTRHLILVTRNVDDFKHFAGLAVENWFSA